MTNKLINYSFIPNNALHYDNIFFVSPNNTIL